MRPAHWRHDRNTFFKYTSAQTAIAVLDTGRLRWSSPSLFNDPFDIQFDLHIDFDVDDLTRKCVAENRRILRSPEYNPVGLMGYLNQLLREHIRLHPDFNLDEEFDGESEAIRQGIQNLLKRLPETQTKQKELLADVKLLCVSEVHDNILMWSHYAERHTGIVLELACTPEVDSAWGGAEAVRYCSEMPKLFDEALAIKLMTGQATLDVAEIMNKTLYSKATDWAYEKEWRIIGGRTPASQLTEDVRFHESELAAVYFGCRTPQEAQLNIAALVGKRYPKAKLFQAVKSERAFTLEFHTMPAV